jgi:hypothetical protein
MCWERAVCPHTLQPARWGERAEKMETTGGSGLTGRSFDLPTARSPEPF